jgi:carbonic anhydrase
MRDRQQGSRISDLLRRNRAWADRKTHTDPTFFARLVGQQRPAFFWIGCADSRVPATEIVDLDPGTMFVHRNVANLAKANDPNFSAALYYAVEMLQIPDILLVGHYGCGGISAVLNSANGAIGHWLAPVRDAFTRHEPELLNYDAEDRAHRLCEINVIEQVRALAVHPIIAESWKNDSDIVLHGLIYGVGDGLIAPVCEADADGLTIRDGYRPYPTVGR